MGGPDLLCLVPLREEIRTQTRPEGRAVEDIGEYATCHQGARPRGSRPCPGLTVGPQPPALCFSGVCVGCPQLTNTELSVRDQKREACKPVYGLPILRGFLGSLT